MPVKLIITCEGVKRYEGEFSDRTEGRRFAQEFIEKNRRSPYEVWDYFMRESVV